MLARRESKEAESLNRSRKRITETNRETGVLDSIFEEDYMHEEGRKSRNEDKKKGYEKEALGKMREKSEGRKKMVFSFMEERKEEKGRRKRTS